MADEIGPKQLQSKFTAPWRQVMAKVPAEKARDKIDKARYEQEPGRQKMRTAPPAVLVKNIVGAGSAHLRTGYVLERYTFFPAVVVVIAANR